MYQPSLNDAFPGGKILLLSYIYDRINPLLPADRRDKLLTISTIADLAKDVCAGPTVWAERWGSDQGAMKALEDDRLLYCLDLTYQYTLLQLGYEFGDDRKAKIGKQIGGTELGWCLGATLAMINTDLTCRE